jgi:hypothetical protein
MTMPPKNNDNKQTRKRLYRELPPLGTKLVGKSRHQEYEAVIVKSSSNPKQRVLRVQDREFSSLSGAASTITGHAINGWIFWKSTSKSKQRSKQ